MHNRINNCFARLSSTKRKAFIPYICAGDPSLDKTVDLVRGLEQAGADLVELGIPFSDPLADGIVNQLAAQRALDAGATVPGVLDCVRKIRATSEIPIVLYTYLNPVLQFGFDEFHREAAAAGVDGVLILDLPPEEDWDEHSTSNAQYPMFNKDKNSVGLIHIRLIAPTTPTDRVRAIAKNATGFLYYVSREGVTGARESIADSLGEHVGELRKCSALPIAVGFGISNPAQAREVAQVADAVVVGSAIVDLIAKHGMRLDLVEKVGSFARELATAIKSV
jgi:tryptophan synthase alpha chain